ncbi:hypothetical protein IQ16_03706 [Bradyrhizobium huanghuaihaiense]|uniref:Uncharacterized protein n=1 Tax=Bradyrhizobium huanghuaihaiense TaxID=990078 RepID=A0A562RNT1_9BRAD|nr:hypothetical protein [Bradyrhizobium huanghuaihaiense]TWI70533.1 hypothetical protein IQ16_03706 [Bradyrhizobium huanghuaihaiense]
MRFITDQSLDRGCAVISEDGGIIIVRPVLRCSSRPAMPLSSAKELRAHADTMRHVKDWIKAGATKRTGL